MGMRKEFGMGMGTKELLGETTAAPADGTQGASGRRRRTLPVIIGDTVGGPIFESPGFAKKKLGCHKIDLLGLCEYGCKYCSSNCGNYLRIHQQKFLEATREQTGIDALPATEPRLMFRYRDIVGKLEKQLAGKARSFGEGKTIVFSMLTDGFSPSLVVDGTTRRALELLLTGTRFRIRVLTKNACVGSAAWVRFFSRHADRFVVGLSAGTLEDGWAKRVEIGTSPPSKRLAALRRLQDAGVPTYGMLCPVFPGVIFGGDIERLVGEIRPERCETIWAEPFNDRNNWRTVRDTYEPGSAAYRWFEPAFASRGASEAWSEYAMDLYERLRELADRGGWLGRLEYLLYEARLTPSQAPRLKDLGGVNLQSAPDDRGLSRNRAVAGLQVDLRGRRRR